MLDDVTTTPRLMLDDVSLHNAPAGGKNLTMQTAGCGD
jgi:hypothetical protein